MTPVRLGLPRILSERQGKWMLNLYPPLLFQRIRVVRIGPGFRSGQVRVGHGLLTRNLHGTTFSKAFAMTRRGRAINTGCLGFGIERLALGLLEQHEVDPDNWPAGLARDFARWSKRQAAAT